jgi:cation transport protein ChaC
MLLTRENLLTGELQRLVAQVEGVRPLTEAELAASREAILGRHQPGQDLWVFAYGSLIWNPAFHHVEQKIARLHGYHRRYCLWTWLGRGTPERPGLMLGLDRGGSCAGIAYRIAAETVEQELDVIWRREMVTGAYAPTWVRLRTEDGNLPAVAFVINHGHERYAPRLSDPEVAAVVSIAEGHLGACRDYLFNTIAHLEQLGLRDRGLERVASLVRELRAEHGAPAEPPASPLSAAAQEPKVVLPGSS